MAEVKKKGRRQKIFFDIEFKLIEKGGRGGGVTRKTQIIRKTKKGEVASVQIREQTYKKNDD